MKSYIHSFESETSIRQRFKKNISTINNDVGLINPYLNYKSFLRFISILVSGIVDRNSRFVKAFQMSYQITCDIYAYAGKILMFLDLELQDILNPLTCELQYTEENRNMK